MNAPKNRVSLSKPQLLLTWIIGFIAAIILLLTSIRVLLIPGFIDFEYSTPGFPADSYGFSKQDRLYWSRFAVSYLLNNEDISYLGRLQFADTSPVFDQRELAHMVDVKKVVGSAMTAWGAGLGLLALLGFATFAIGWRDVFVEGVRRGGWLSLTLIVGILALVLIAFGVLFIAFHNVFFEPGTWTFLWSDTLIRLFPERFWRDMFIYIGLMTAAFGLIILWLTGGFRRVSASRS